MGPRQPFDMSLRLWSDERPLGPVLSGAGLASTHVHVRGEPIADTGALAGRIARRHYASTVPAQGQDASDVRAWLSTTMDVVAHAAPLREGLAAGRIEGLLWIAILGPSALDMPEVEAALVGKAEALGLKMLVENYTRPEEADSFPEKLWLTGPAADGRGA